MDDESNPPSPLSFKHKLKESLCCFRRRNGGHFSLDHSPSAVVWIKAKGAHEHKCRPVLGFPGAKHRRPRQSSVEFRYDPLSYAMNFEDEFGCDDEAPLRNFSARLPPSPAAVT